MSSTALRSLTRSAAAAILAVVLAVMTAVSLAPTASAHTDLTSSDPADGAELSVPPTAITLVFAQSMQEYGAQLVLTGPDGAPQPLSAPVFDGATVRSEVGPLTLGGGYTIAYRIVSTDGHPIQGALTFQLTLPAAPATTPLSTPAAGALASAVRDPDLSSPEPMSAASSAGTASASATSPAEPSSAGATSVSTAASTSEAATSGEAITPAADSDSMSAASVWAIVAVAAAFAAVVIAVLVVQRRRRS